MKMNYVYYYYVSIDVYRLAVILNFLNQKTKKELIFRFLLSAFTIHLNLK